MFGVVKSSNVLKKMGTGVEGARSKRNFLTMVAKHSLISW